MGFYLFPRCVLSSPELRLLILILVSTGINDCQDLSSSSLQAFLVYMCVSRPASLMCATRRVRGLSVADRRINDRFAYVVGGFFGWSIVVLCFRVSSYIQTVAAAVVCALRLRL